VGFAVLWVAGQLTIATASFTLICAQIVATLVALVAVWNQLRPRWEPSWPEFKASMGYALRDYPGGIANFTTLRLDQLMLGAMASSAAIGLYVVAVRLSEVTTLAADALAGALMPEVASSRASKSAESLWARSLRLTIYIHVLILAPLWLAAPFILKTLFGEAFLPATGAFRWLLLAAAVWGSGSIVISGLRGFGYPGLSTTARFSSALVTAIALPILLPRLGIEFECFSVLLDCLIVAARAVHGITQVLADAKRKWVAGQRPLAFCKGFAESPHHNQEKGIRVVYFVEPWT